MPQRHIKVCLLGDPGAGKTSLVRRFAYNTFDRHYLPSCSLTVSTKTVVLQEERSLVAHTIVLWDPASNLQSPLPYAAFLDRAHAVVLVADSTQAGTCDRLRAYVEPILRYCPNSQICIVATKADAGVRSRDADSAQSADFEAFAHEIGATLHFTSALRDLGIDALFRTLALDVARRRTTGVIDE